MITVALTDHLDQIFPVAIRISMEKEIKEKKSVKDFFNGSRKAVLIKLTRF